MKEKETACAYGVLPFFLASNPSRYVSFVTHGGSIFKKKKRDRSHLGLIAVAIFTSATDAFTLRKHFSFISEYICVNGSKKKKGEEQLACGTL